jgi:glucosamine--fructose-6-phosphate aminotransferase (isomerizing)
VNDESKAVHDMQIKNLLGRGAKIINLHQCDNCLHPRVAPFAVLQRFYLDVEQVAIAKGLNPDEPVGLK